MILGETAVQYDVGDIGTILFFGRAIAGGNFIVLNQKLGDICQIILNLCGQMGDVGFHETSPLKPIRLMNGYIKFIRVNKLLVNKHRYSVLRRGLAMSASVKVGVVRAMRVLTHLHGLYNIKVKYCFNEYIVVKNE